MFNSKNYCNNQNKNKTKTALYCYEVETWLELRVTDRILPRWNDTIWNENSHLISHDNFQKKYFRKQQINRILQTAAKVVILVLSIGKIPVGKKKEKFKRQKSQIEQSKEQ